MKNIEQNIDVVAVHLEALKAAHKAEYEFMQAHGEPAYCGFAGVKLFVDGRKPVAKKLVKEGIASKGWDNGYIIWNPAGNPTQSMDIKEVGADAYAKVWRNYGVSAWAQSRAD